MYESFDLYGAFTIDEKFLHLGACENSNGFYVCTDKSLSVWNISKSTHQSLVNHEVRGIIVSPSGRYAQCDQAGNVQVRRFDQLEPEQQFQVDAESIPLATSEEMQYLLLGNTGQSPQLWSLPNAKKLCDLQVRLLNVHYTDNRGACAFSADESRVAVPTSDYGIAVFSVPEGKQVRVLHGHKQGVVSIAFSPTNKNFLASCSWDNTVRLWDLSSGKELATMRHSQWIASVTFSPDGTRLASVAGDQKLKVWHVPSGQQILTADTGFSHPRSVRFSTDGMSIAVAQAFDPDKDQEFSAYRVFRGDPVH